MLYKDAQHVLNNSVADPNRLIFWSNHYMIYEGCDIFFCAKHKLVENE
uniref:Uncharacterized protein n=1 Tax=Setaria viridis TaxID=4556 RepID=A0A4U6T8V3_SETVI|nr:hypothetical protein SEVIR_9G553400v2 [Setaria viridis]